MTDKEKIPAPSGDVSDAPGPAPEAGFFYPVAGGSYIRNPKTGELTPVVQEHINVDL